MSSTSAAEIAREVREKIRSGSLRAGEPLRQEELARRYSVSAIPIREALARLEGEGLVQLRPHRGAVVAPLSAAEYRELTEMRALLECHALRLAAPAITASRAAQAERVLARIDRMPSKWGQLNTEFHRILYDASMRPRLCETIAALNRNVERYLHEEAILENPAESQKEHRRLLRLIEKRDIDEAVELLRVHILEPMPALVHHLELSGNP